MKTLCVIFVIMLLIPSCIVMAAEEDLKTLIDECVDGQKTILGVPGEDLLDKKELLPAGSSISDWSAFAFALAGAEDNYGAYIRELEKYVTSQYKENGVLDNIKSTEYHRIALTVLALGGDPTAFGKDGSGNPVNLIADGTYNFHGESLGLQGLNGWIFALITLDAMDYSAPEGAKFTREDMLSAILEAQEPDGGFGLAEGASSVDITAMALQAIGPYRDREDVSKAIDKAVDYLAGQMSESGFYMSYDVISAESSAQVIIGLCSSGIDPEKDERFTKNGNTIVDNLLSMRISDGGFAHSPGDSEGDPMATQQAMMALLALDRLRNGEEEIYSFVSYVPPEYQTGGGGTTVIIICVAAVVLAAAVVLIIKKTRGKKNV